MSERTKSMPEAPTDYPVFLIVDAVDVTSAIVERSSFMAGILIADDH